MIYSMNIKNVALINEANIDFSDGFNVITGETGAGKSVLIGSVNMLLGERVNKDIITNGADCAEVSAVFYIENEEVRRHLGEMGIDIDETGELVMSRQIFHDSKNICRMNGTAVSATMLKNAGRLIVDLHGQHNNQALLDKDMHIDFLDKFAGDEIREKLNEYMAEYRRLRKLQKDLDRLSESAEERERKIDILNYEINEIKSVSPEVGEDEELKRKKEIADNFKKLCSSVGKAYYCLYDDTEGRSAYQSMTQSAQALAEASEIDGGLKETAELLDSIVIQIQEASRTVSSYLDSLENSVESDFDIDARIDEIYKLKRKYGGSIESVLAHLESSETELEFLNNSDDRLNDLITEVNKSAQKAGKLALELSKIRKKTAERIEKEICSNLKFLNMEDAVFSVGFEECELSKMGCDKVEFLLTTIKGAPPKPLAKIASGGELSRIMLAIKTVLAESDVVKTMIFDEIDTGVSGIAAQKIGDKIKELSKTKQIFCVTHLAQIASKADTHFKIEKTSDDKKTQASVDKLDENGRINELARIISGDKVSSTTIAQAKEMLGI